MSYLLLENWLQSCSQDDARPQQAFVAMLEVAFAAPGLTQVDGKPRHLFHAVSDDQTRPWPARDLPAFAEYSLRQAEDPSPNPISLAPELQTVDWEQEEETWSH